MIESAEDFVRLRTSPDPACTTRATHDEAAPSTWRDIITRYPAMRLWVATNKTVPLEILEILRQDPDPSIRTLVKAKRTWTAAHPEDSLTPR